MKISQQVSHVREDRYRSDISVTGIPKGFFPAITTNAIGQDNSTREIIITIMPLEQSPGGNINCATGRFQRRTEEMTIKFSVVKDGEELVVESFEYSSDDLKSSDELKS